MFDHVLLIVLSADAWSSLPPWWPIAFFLAALSLGGYTIVQKSDVKESDSYETGTTPVRPSPVPKALDGLSPRRLHDLGVTAEEAGDNVKARDCYMRAASAGWAPSIMALGRLAHQSSNSRAARRWSEQALAAGEKGALIELGLLAQDAGDIAEARRCWEQAIEDGARVREAQQNLVLLKADKSGHRYGALGEVGGSDSDSTSWQVSPTPPRKVRVSTDEGGVLVEWDPPKQQPSPVDRYDIQVYRATGGAAQVFTSTGQSVVITRDHFDLTGDYMVRVRAVFGKWEGPYSVRHELRFTPTAFAPEEDKIEGELMGHRPSSARVKAAMLELAARQVALARGDLTISSPAPDAHVYRKVNIPGETLWAIRLPMESVAGEAYELRNFATLSGDYLSWGDIVWAARNGEFIPEIVGILKRSGHITLSFEVTDAVPTTSRDAVGTAIGEALLAAGAIGQSGLSIAIGTVRCPDTVESVSDAFEWCRQVATGALDAGEPAHGLIQGGDLPVRFALASCPDLGTLFDSGSEITMSSLAHRCSAEGDTDSALLLWEADAYGGSPWALASFNWHMLEAGQHARAREVFDLAMPRCRASYAAHQHESLEPDSEWMASFSSELANAISNDVLVGLALGEPPEAARRVWKTLVQGSVTSLVEPLVCPAVLEWRGGDHASAIKLVQALPDDIVEEAREILVHEAHEATGWFQQWARDGLELLETVP